MVGYSVNRTSAKHFERGHTREASFVDPEHDDALLRLAVSMQRNIPVGSRRLHIFKKYKDCFSGMEAVDWMLEQMEAKSVLEAIRKGQELFDAKYIIRVERETKFEYAKKRFYKFTPLAPEIEQKIVDVPRNFSYLQTFSPLSEHSRQRAIAAILGAFVADAASTACNGMLYPESIIPGILRDDFEPAFVGCPGSGFQFPKGSRKIESSTGFESRMILRSIAKRGTVTGSILTKDAYFGFNTNRRMVSVLTHKYMNNVQKGNVYPHCAVKCRSIDMLAGLPAVVALYAGTDCLFQQVDEFVKVFYTGKRVRDTALVAAYVLEQIILGASVLQALQLSIRTERLTIKQRMLIFKALSSNVGSGYDAIRKFGTTGSLPAGFYALLQPLVLLPDYPTAIRENIRAGGRVCRRAMFIGACFAAQDGIHGIPKSWIEKTLYYDAVKKDAEALMARRHIDSRIRLSEETSSLKRAQSTPYVDFDPNKVSSSPRLTATLLRKNQAALYRTTADSEQSMYSEVDAHEDGDVVYSRSFDDDQYGQHYGTSPSTGYGTGRLKQSKSFHDNPRTVHHLRKNPYATSRSMSEMHKPRTQQPLEAKDFQYDRYSSSGKSYYERPQDGNSRYSLRKKSFESTVTSEGGSDIASEVASNFSYNSHAPSACSSSYGEIDVGMDFGDMDRFYVMAGATSPRAKELLDLEMQKLLKTFKSQHDGSSRGSLSRAPILQQLSRGSLGNKLSNNHTRQSTNTGHYRNSGSSKQSPPRTSSSSLPSFVGGGVLNTRTSLLGMRPSYPLNLNPLARVSTPMVPSNDADLDLEFSMDEPEDEMEGNSLDVEYLPRVSLGGEQRVSLHAVL